MKKTTLPKILVLGGFLSFSAFNSFAQNVGINATGATPNSSAMLDISSTEKGLLAPRMTQVQRNAISTPATGLLIFQTDNTSGFYYFDGAAWTQVGGAGSVGATGATGPTGPAGPAGAQGIQGATGATGAAGAAGAQGIQGLTGATGTAGTNGTNGTNGTAGATGATGPAPSGTGIVTVSSGTLGTPGALTGDVTTSGAGLATTIADNSVDGTDIDLGSSANGGLMYYNGTDWVNLAAGTAGQVLQTNGAAAPTWVTKSNKFIVNTAVSFTPANATTNYSFVTGGALTTNVMGPYSTTTPTSVPYYAVLADAALNATSSCKLTKISGHIQNYTYINAGSGTIYIYKYSPVNNTAYNTNLTGTLLNTGGTAFSYSASSIGTFSATVPTNSIAPGDIIVVWWVQSALVSGSRYLGNVTLEFENN